MRLPSPPHPHSPVVIMQSITKPVVIMQLVTKPVVIKQPVTKPAVIKQLVTEAAGPGPSEVRSYGSSARTRPATT